MGGRMTPNKKVILIFITILITISGVTLFNYDYNNSFSNEPATSTVYIENGVSGIVTITDPFLNKTSQIKIDYYPLCTGSGVIITSDGYIITAFHVIGDPKTSSEQNKAKKMENYDTIYYLEKAAVNDYISHINPQLGNQLIHNSTENPQYHDVADIDMVITYLRQKNLMDAKSAKQVIKVKLPPSTGINSIHPYNAQIIDVGDPEKNEDMALLKINPVKNLPALEITSKKPIIGDNIRIYGYPGNVRMYHSGKNSLTPSSSSGFLTATKPNTRGTVYYQTSAPTAKGYSGGPVTNNQNKIVGIIIYGIEKHSYFGKQFKSESSLFISSKHLIKICKENNVTSYT